MGNQSGQHDNAIHSQITTPQSTGTKTPSCRTSKTDQLRQTLSDLLPSQHDVNIICNETNCWYVAQDFGFVRVFLRGYHNLFLLHRYLHSQNHSANIYLSRLLVQYLNRNSFMVFEKPDSGSPMSSAFNVAETIKLGPAYIARTLLYLGVCVQQLSPQFDISRLHINLSLKTLVDKLTTTGMYLFPANMSYH